MATPSMAAPPRIHLYAELLQNIRQVSVSASFSFAGDVSPSSFAAAVRAEVLPDGVTLCVRSVSADEKTLLTLPGRVAAGGSRLPVAQGRPGTGSGDDKRNWHVSWRLPLAGPPAPTTAAAEDNPVPWSAPDLPPGSPVACRSCTAVLVTAGRVRAWKDLPSENWAEMMEFWHCHKPDHRENGTELAGKAGDAVLAARGYGANSGIAAEPGVGFVDLNALLFAESDCQEVLILLPIACATDTTTLKQMVYQKLLSSACGVHDALCGCRAVSCRPAAKTCFLACPITAAARVPGFQWSDERLHTTFQPAVLFWSAGLTGLQFSQSSVEQASASRQSLSASETDRPASESVPPRPLRVFCSACRAHVGYFHDRMQSVNLFKWAVQLEPHSPRPSVLDCLAATLTTTVARTGSSKTVILPVDDVRPPPSGSRETVLHIWILNGNIRYASSLRKEQTPVPAIKLLYKYIGRREADDLLDRLNSDVQETNLPSDGIQTVAAALDASNALLPSTERTFKEWKIGLLERWSGPGPTGA